MLSKPNLSVPDGLQNSNIPSTLGPIAAPVTVIIPCFDPSLEPLQEALDSLRLSTFRNFKVILVDDGSQEPGALAAMAQACAADARVSLLRHPSNRGLSAARNSGVDASDTPYIVFLDADDRLEPTFIEKCLWALETHPDWSFCSTWISGFGARQFQYTRGFERGPEFLERNQVTAIAAVRREADRAVGGHDETIRQGNEDWDYWLKMAAHGFWGGTIPEYLAGYRQHAVPTQWPNRDDPQFRAQFLGELRRRYPQLWRGSFPRPRVAGRKPGAGPLNEAIPFANRLEKAAGVRHSLLMLSWLAATDEEGAQLAALRRAGDEVIVCATAQGMHPAVESGAGLPPNWFVLPYFLAVEDYPRFLVYLIESRQVDRIVAFRSEFASRLRPYLRIRFPGILFEEAPLAGEAPPPGAVNRPAGDGRTVALEAVRAAWRAGRRERAAARVRFGAGPAEPVIMRLRSRVLHPLYYWAISHRLAWLAALRDRLLRREP